jgi:signal transduction histidine kinase
MLNGTDNVVVRAVGRLPSPVRTKLLVAFLGIVALLVVLAVLALRVLGDSNDRVAALGQLEQRATKYQELQTDAIQLRLLLTLRAGGGDARVYVGESADSAPQGAVLLAIDQTTVVTTVSRFGTDIAQLGFDPPAGEAADVATVTADYASFSDVMRRIAAFDEAGSPAAGLDLQSTDAEPLAERLATTTGRLADETQRLTAETIAANTSAYDASRQLFIAVAVASAALALLLGYVLSWSLVGPIKRMETRLNAIAAGDFAGRVDVPNRDELGSLAANINVMNDELARLYGELDAASRHKSEFLANMSHELRTPLNAIIGFSQVLRQQMFGPLNERQAEYLDDVLISGQHLLTLINDILDLSKVEAGRMELQRATFWLPAALDTAISMIRERAAREGVALDLDVAPDLGAIEADERKVKQVLFNLLSNAVKFTPSGGRVTVSARASGDEVLISVADTGVGIEPEAQERIFEEFFQAGAGTTQEGTGLGLALARRFVELHGGRLWVESSAGVGSTFAFTLPLRAPESATSEVRADGTTEEAVPA